jgi:prepilin-type N-terminal cleavage/methylation domain-containing protein
MALNAELPIMPSGWRVREALSYDLPRLWPAEYEAAVRQFEQAGPAERSAFLRRAGVRRCVLPVTERRQWRVVADVPDWNMRVFECDPGATRAFVTSSAEVSRDPADLAWQRGALFDTAVADEVARLAAMPVTSAPAGTPEGPSVRIVQDGGTTVVVEAAAVRAGVLVLRDSYDPSWTAEVDGIRSDIVRANGLYRAVALPPGRHVIRFSYRPRDLMTGLIISGMTALLLTSMFAGSRRRPRARAQAGFTLIELMVVLAIIAVLMAIAFNEYRGMQAKGNDVSALASMRSIAAAQWQFALTCGNMKYASTLPALAQPVPSTGHGFLSPDLTVGPDPFEKSGYIFQMAAKPLDSGVPACNGTVPAEGYAATADPVNPGVTGTIFYGVNADRIIYVDPKETFTGNLSESGAPKHGAEVK